MSSHVGRRSRVDFPSDRICFLCPFCVEYAVRPNRAFSAGELALHESSRRRAAEKRRAFGAYSQAGAGLAIVRCRRQQLAFRKAGKSPCCDLRTGKPIKLMKKLICILASVALFGACEQKSTTVNPPAEKKTENNTTVVNPAEKKTETNTTVVNPVKKIESSTSTTTSSPH